MTLSKRQLKKLNQQESVPVHYVGNEFKSWWGERFYIATPRATIYGGHVNAQWEITDPDGNSFIVAERTLMDELEKDWAIAEVKERLCDGCNAEIFVGANYEPEMCCNGFECGCYGLPLNPALCEKCANRVWGTEVASNA